MSDDAAGERRSAPAGQPPAPPRAAGKISGPAPARRGFFRSPVLWPIAGILLLVVVNLLRDPTFLKVTIFERHFFGVPIDLLNHSAPIMVLALGMTLVIATGGIDLSVGSLVAITGAVAAMAMARGVESLPLIVAAALGCGALAGAINGVLVAYAGVQPIVATLIFMVAGRGIAQSLTGGNVILIKHPAFEFLGNGFFLALPFSALLAAALYGVAQLGLRRTAGRLFIEAVGDNPVASRFAGVPAARTTCLVYIVSGICAGIAGVLVASNIRTADPLQAGQNMELDAIFAVVVGGTALTGGRFLLSGSFVGALLLQTLTVTMLFVGVKPEVATVPKALLILLVCLLQSERTRGWLRGLFARRAPA
ncbi:MAG TPA: ABC transporter permease [Opitutaceae bacterium]|nr:ABC transporter permease [Opitutaceae bacterium]